MQPHIKTVISNRDDISDKKILHLYFQFSKKYKKYSLLNISSNGSHEIETKPFQIFA